MPEKQKQAAHLPTAHELADDLTQHRRFVVNFRSVFYGIVFFLIFAQTVAILGLVSYELHKYGNGYANYASMEYKHALGLLLFGSLLSLLIVLPHLWLGVGFTFICALIAALFFATGAGVVFRTTPFRGHACHRTPASAYPAAWQPYAGECGRIVAIQGLAWALFATYFILALATFFQKFSVKSRPTPEGFYFSKPGPKKLV
ncbi:hypothetical protein FA15DRAFT_641893 [Coprinopsis marcescibilis]|uniref:MARVEL domain-containing protein n=1 Tax=Coprinopsis marcescibilis TaxID=230819 RepID=A0A5C3KUI5_COPMA|nr:hypothetical protein FA15DRAFT_641893 [Coprinopsis marcescibilis]